MKGTLKRFTLVVTAVLTLAACRTAVADGYNITDLGQLPGQPNTSGWQQCMNQNGLIAVYANASLDNICNGVLLGDSAFAWKNGAMFPLPGLGNAIDTIAEAVNNHGQFVGRSRPAGDFPHGVLWDHGVIYLLGELSGDNRSNALFINDAGVAVGWSFNNASGIRSAVKWSKGTATALPPLPGGAFNIAFGINDPGQIVGISGPAAGLEHATLWDKSGAHDLGTLGGPSSDAIAINNKGQVAGYSDTATGGADGFLWSNGVMIDLPILPGDVGVFVAGLNNQGVVVGSSGVSFAGGNTSNNCSSHAVMWVNGQVIDLQTKIAAGSGWTLTGGQAINDRGEIVAQGVYNGVPRLVLLTPAKK